MQTEERKSEIEEQKKEVNEIMEGCSIPTGLNKVRNQYPIVFVRDDMEIYEFNYNHERSPTNSSVETLIPSEDGTTGFVYVLEKGTCYESMIGPRKILAKFEVKVKRDKPWEFPKTSYRPVDYDRHPTQSPTQN